MLKTVQVIEGYTVTDTRQLANTYAKQQEETRRLQQKEVDFARYKQMSAEAIRNMSMAEYAKLRKGSQNYGVSTNVGGPPVIGGNEYRIGANLSPFDKWKAAREQYIAGTITDIEMVLRFVRDEDSDRYIALVDLEIKEERAAKEVANSGLHKHRFRWCRWPSWRWLVAWLHR